MENNTAKPEPYRPRSQREAGITLTLGHTYEFIRRLGTGAYATVFAVLNKQLERVEALKVLSDDLTQQPDFLDRFKVEAKISASLSHPNIVTVYEYKKVNEFYFFTMPFVDGPLLTEFIAPSNPMPVHRVCTTLATVCDAIGYAHKRGVIHRDLKASNIMLDKTGKPYITDFGIAKWEKALIRTRTGIFMGSPHYVSPEQAEGREIDARSDIYSLGVTLYVLLTQEYPFQGDTPNLTIARRLLQPPPPPETLKPELPRRLIEIINKSLQMHRRNRYQSAEEMAKDLTEFVEHAKDERRVTELTQQTTIHPPRRKSWAPAAIVLVTLLVIQGLVLFFLIRNNSENINDNTDDPPKEQVRSEFQTVRPPPDHAPIKPPAKEKSDPELDLLISAVEQKYLDGDYTACIDAAAAIKTIIKKLPTERQNHYTGIQEKAENYQLMAIQAIHGENQLKQAPQTSPNAETKRPGSLPRPSGGNKKNDAPAAPTSKKPKIEKPEAATQQRRIRELKANSEILLKKIERQFENGDDDACLQTAEDAISNIERLSKTQQKQFKRIKAKIVVYQEKANQSKKINAQKRSTTKQLQNMLFEIERQFQRGDYESCLQTAKTAISNIENLSEDQQKQHAQIKAQILVYRKKTARLKNIQNQKRFITETIKTKIAKGDFKGAVNMVNAMLTQPDLSYEIRDALHEHRKNLDMLIKNDQ